MFQVEPYLYGNLPFTLSKCCDSSIEKQRAWFLKLEQSPVNCLEMAPFHSPAIPAYQLPTC